MSDISHEHRLRVRYAETDQMGVAHHAGYLIYMEEARTRMMADRGCSYAELERQGIGLPVRKAEVRYRRSAYYEEELLVTTTVAATRAASITFAYELRRAENGELVATGTTELACVRLDAEDRKPIPLPQLLRARLEGPQAEGL